MHPTRTAARANGGTRLGASRQEVVFEGSQTPPGKSRSNFLDAPRIGELELYAKSGIARLALPALRVNQRIVTFDAAVVSGDTSKAAVALSVTLHSISRRSGFASQERVPGEACPDRPLSERASRKSQLPDKCLISILSFSSPSLPRYWPSPSTAPLES